MKNYRPLPDCLTVKSSKIEGLGLFATTDIEKNTVLGISHILYQKEYIRTPLGGFFNHSDTPNCEAYIKEDYICLRSLREIDKDEEITVKYWLYKIIME